MATTDHGQQAPTGKGEGSKVVYHPIFTTLEDEEYVYKMNRPNRGVAIIINNKVFETEKLNNRNGTDVDAHNLEGKLNQLGFLVKTYDNVKAKDMAKIVNAFASEDHSKNDCMMVCVLSHGENGILFGVDGDIKQLEDGELEFSNYITIDELTKPFRGDLCDSLVGKPKIFILQACRGDKYDDGVAIDHEDSATPGGQAEKIPVEADFLLAYSTVAGYYSWRNKVRGSWFIQALCDMIYQFGSKMDFVRLLTRVSYHVAAEFESRTPLKPSTDKKKEMPSINSMLRKDLFFTQK